MKIVAFGDSITQGIIGVTPEENWLFLLGKKLGDSFLCINAGVGGNSAREAMARYDKDVLSHSPDIIFLEFGGNNHDPWNKERVVEDLEFREHLADFKKKLPEKCRTVVVTFPPIINEQHAYTVAFPELDLDGNMQAQRQIVREFAAENHYPLLDLYKIMYPDRYKLIQKDGVHLNAAGQVVFADSMYQLLKETGWLDQR